MAPRLNLSLAETAIFMSSERSTHTRSIVSLHRSLLFDYSTLLLIFGQLRLHTMATDLSDELLLLVLLDALFNLLRLEVVWVVEDVVAVQGLDSSNFLLLRFLLCFGEVLFCLNSPPFHVVRLHNAVELLFDVLLLKLQSLKEVAVQVF